MRLRNQLREGQTQTGCMPLAVRRMRSRADMEVHHALTALRKRSGDRPGPLSQTVMTAYSIVSSSKAGRVSQVSVKVMLPGSDETATAFRSRL